MTSFSTNRSKTWVVYRNFILCISLFIQMTQFLALLYTFQCIFNARIVKFLIQSI